MLETSKDILNWALAIGSISALLGLAFVFVYTAKILRQVFKMMSTVEGAFEAVRSLFESIGERISNASSLGKFAVDVVKLVGDVSNVKDDILGENKKKKGSKKKPAKKK